MSDDARIRIESSLEDLAGRPSPRRWRDRGRAAWAPAVALLATTAAWAQGDVFAVTGDPAPGFPAGYSIAGFVEPPTATQYRYFPSLTCAVARVSIDGPGSDDPEAIYYWDSTAGLILVATQSDVATFADGPHELAFFETPTIDEHCSVAFTATLDVGRGMLFWDGTNPLQGVARTGQAVSIACETVNGASCGSLPGVLTTLGSFASRASATLWRDRLFFRAAVDPDSVGGLPDALWTWDKFGGLQPVANGFQRADGVDYSVEKPFFQSFTNVADCGYLYGLADISLNAPKTVYEYDPNGVGHGLLHRSYAPDATPRFDFHCDGEQIDYLFVGGASNAAFDGDTTKKGVWHQGGQVYSQGVTPAPGVSGGTLGAALGAAFLGNGYSLFAARIVGGLYDGLSGVWWAADGPLSRIASEGQTLPGGQYAIYTIHTAHASKSGFVLLHLDRIDLVSDEIFEALYLWYPTILGGGLLEVLAEGDPWLLDGQEVEVTGFRLLGRNFSSVVVTGNGADGHLSAFTQNARVALVIDFVASAASPAAAGVSATGSGALSIELTNVLFLDDFETGNADRWSDRVPG